MSIRVRPFPILLLLMLVPLACTAEQESAGQDPAGGQVEASQASADTGSADDTTGGNADGAPEDAEAIKDRIRARLREQRPNIEITSVRATPVPDIYEIVAAGQVYYITPDAQYLFSGNLIDLEAGRNVTQERQGELAHQVVKGMDTDRMVVFEPANGPARHHITVFTDTTCGYCRRLHEEVLAMVEAYPVEVRYAMFPRAGRDSAAADTLRDVWCADDPATALTRAKQGQSVAERGSSCETPLDEHLAAANSIGVRGTPYLLIGDDGPLVPGYRPKRELLSMLGIEARP